MKIFIGQQVTSLIRFLHIQCIQLSQNLQELPLNLRKQLAKLKRVDSLHGPAIKFTGN